MAVSQETLDRVRKIPMTSILEAEEIPFKTNGREAVTLCPWHADTHPSLTVNDDKGLCFCFACRSGSDSIAYVQQKFGLDFSEAVRRIAERHNVAFVEDNIDPEVAVQRAKVRANALAELQTQQDRFRANITSPRATRIHKFLADRGIIAATSKHFALGYATDGFFADRVTVPILDHRGTLVGFTGRATRDEMKPKYKNSESSELFDKSEIVYNEYNALQYIREAGSVIFVEGHFDVISLWQHGVRNVVAMQGTGAPSESVIKRLMKRTKRFILCYDGDEGGRKAIEQFIKSTGHLACQGQLTITIATLPEGMDPDEYVRQPDSDFYSLVESAPPWLDWQLDVWLRGLDRTDVQAFSNVERLVREFVESIQSPALRRHYVDKATRILAEDPIAAAALAQDWVANMPRLRTRRKWFKPEPSFTRNLVERRLLRLYIHFPDLRQYCRPIMDMLQFPSYRWLWRRLQELEESSAVDLTPHSVMAVLAVAEPHYTRQLRPLAVPTIKVCRDPGILRHIEDVMCSSLTVDL